MMSYCKESAFWQDVYDRLIVNYESGLLLLVDDTQDKQLSVVNERVGMFLFHGRKIWQGTLPNLGDLFHPDTLLGRTWRGSENLSSLDLFYMLHTLSRAGTFFKWAKILSLAVDL